MKKTLIIVESPTKQKTISKILGSEYLVRASFGHVVEVAHSGSRNIGIDLENQFKIKYVYAKDKLDKLQSITDAAICCDKILLASDQDREGEAIAWHLAKYLNSSLGEGAVPMYRAHFREMTKEGIEEGLNHLSFIDEALVDAQQARRAVDRIVGYTVSPFLNHSFNQNLSAGRVQSVAVRLVVDREKEIENFKPEDYWNLFVVLSPNGSEQDKFFAKYLNKITEQSRAEQIKNQLEQDTFQITELKPKEEQKKPNAPFVTSTLLIAAANELRFSAEKTMKLAQNLYESGYITYMRTDSCRVSPEAIEKCRSWLTEHQHEIPNKPNLYLNKDQAQDAHEAIRPTSIKTLASNINLPDGAPQLYQLIWEQFVASQMKPALYDTVNVTITSSSGYVFKINGKILKYKGWLAIRKEETAQDIKLPLLTKGQNLFLVSPKIKIDKKQTQPPSRYTEAALIKELEKRGIGRPATYASIMSKITDKSYVLKKNQSFSATEIGKKIIDLLVDHFNFIEYEYTADLEVKLDQVANKKLKYVDMMRGFYDPFAEQLKKAYASKQQSFGYECEFCQEPMGLKHGMYGYYMACINYPACKNTFSCELVDGKPIKKEGNDLVEGETCPKCNSDMFQKNGKFGPYYACSLYPKCKGSKKIKFGKQCPQCKSDLYATLIEGRLQLSCMAYPLCRYREDLPNEQQNSWRNPEELGTIQVNKNLNKILKLAKMQKVKNEA